MLSRFTERGQRVITLAQEEARRLGQDRVGTEHLLLGVLREPEGVASKVLKALGVNPTQLRTTTEKILGLGGAPPMREYSHTDLARRVLADLAPDEARLMGHQYVGTAHILLGLMREGEGGAGMVLQGAGLVLEQARRQVAQELGTAPLKGVRGRQPSPVEPELVRLLSEAATEAMNLNDETAGPEHLLLALLRNHRGPVTEALAEKGVTLSWLEQRLKGNG